MSALSSPQAPLSARVATVIRAGTRFEGLLTFRGEVRVEGCLEGEVVAEGRLEIGQGAEVRARVAVDELLVDGLLEGEIVARRRAELRSGARVVGTLRTPRPVMAEGARFDGRCETAAAGEPGAPAAAAGAPKRSASS